MDQGIAQARWAAWSASLKAVKTGRLAEVFADEEAATGQ
jgi:hypothetical protein